MKLTITLVGLLASASSVFAHHNGTHHTILNNGTLSAHNSNGTHNGTDVYQNGTWTGNIVHRPRLGQNGTVAFCINETHVSVHRHIMNGILIGVSCNKTAIVPKQPKQPRAQKFTA
ncbi:hypothetical protein IQ06DRAFT_351562 [Phaeosphaeriaceae sp. SRC1lsM3a]|nr:hypothetical protein IQ06DRAFT_351562 [Stagonospora sp. SRC1lsM3a]